MEDFEKMGTDDEQEKACSNLSGKLRLPWMMLRQWWCEENGNLLNINIPLCMKERMKWFFVLKTDNPRYFFSVYKGPRVETKTYTAYTSRKFKDEEETGFTIDQELKKMLLKIVHLRNLSMQAAEEREQMKKEKEQEKREKEQERKDKEQEKREKEQNKKEKEQDKKDKEKKNREENKIKDQEKKEREQEKEERKQIFEILQSIQRNQ